MDSKIKLVAITCAGLVVATILGIVALYHIGTRKQDDLRKQVTEAVAGIEGAENAETALQDAALYEEYGLDPAKNPYAFLDDEAFFEKPLAEQEGEKVSLLVTSVQKDIRIHVVGEDGAPVGGVPFSVMITDSLGNPVSDSGSPDVPERSDTPGKSDAQDNSGDAQTEQKEQSEQTEISPANDREEEPAAPQAQPGVYLDEDEDGMIFVSGLPGGDYKVSLLPTDGYVIPGSDTPIGVSDELSYTLLSDISFLIKSEDEIDAKEEDTGVNEAERDADGTETNVRLADGASIFGIDVSKWNKEIDWKKAKQAGVEFAIIRCGYRGSKTGALVEDPYFEKNIKGAQEAGVRVGVYFFTQAVSAVEAVEEASMVLTLCRDYQIAFPMYIDTEGAGGNGRADGLDVDARTEVVRAFCETIENAGFTAGVYASKNWLEKKLHADSLASYQIWLAQYARSATYQGEYGMWQYTSAGTVDGISTLVDFNVSYMDY